MGRHTLYLMTRKSAKGMVFLLSVLPHPQKARCRLNKQYDLFLTVYDNQLLHVPIELSEQDSVLETGTGTGIWLMNLAKTISAGPQLIGIDIEPKLFPEPSVLPSNIRFEVQSVLKLPSEWTNKFSVVNQRLLVAGLRAHEWPQAISELYRVTKPGGWIQVFEPDAWTSGPSMNKISELLLKISDDQGTMWCEIGQRIPSFLERSGFVNIRHNPRATVCGAWAGEHGVAGRDNMLGVFRGLKSPVLNAGGYGVVTSEVEFDSIIEELGKEYDARPGSQVVWTLYTAQKPLDIVKAKA
ncbi:hypothetical protein NP233_g7937 [Leucocoprinus birnbaumii]|uniref:Methyltransferase domain-containing protein n=1 Tax=Leucocoprinus birnbaumii TaxID=56174 RepID=A0AAD5VN69_9AGAR|nr:hypothetical protein NP233_g7937 [Leucocoprinus birnbaumii]